MTTYLKVQDPFDKSRKVKALRASNRMGGTTSHNGKLDTPEMEKRSQAHHEANMRKHEARHKALST
jgi:hypothetical protein